MIIRNHGTTGLFFFFTVANNCKCKKQVISVFKIFTHVICLFSKSFFRSVIILCFVWSAGLSNNKTACIFL